MLDRVVEKLREEFVHHGRPEHFERLKVFLLGRSDAPYAALAREMNTSEGALQGGDSQASQEVSRALSPRDRGYCGRSRGSGVGTPVFGGRAREQVERLIESQPESSERRACRRRNMTARGATAKTSPTPCARASQTPTAPLGALIRRKVLEKPRLLFGKQPLARLPPSAGPSRRSHWGPRSTGRTATRPPRRSSTQLAMLCAVAPGRSR